MSYNLSLIVSKGKSKKQFNKVKKKKSISYNFEFSLNN